MENINGQIHSSEGDAFYDYTRPGLAHTDPPLSFETGGENPLPPTGDTIGGEGGGTTSHPFKVVATDDTKVKVVYGEVGGEVPTQCAVDLENATEITVEADNYVYLDITLDGTTGDITSVAIAAGANTPLDTDTKAYIDIAKIEFDSGKISATGQILTHSLGHWSCEDRHHFWGI